MAYTAHDIRTDSSLTACEKRARIKGIIARHQPNAQRWLDCIKLVDDMRADFYYNEESAKKEYALACGYSGNNTPSSTNPEYWLKCRRNGKTIYAKVYFIRELNGQILKTRRLTTRRLGV